jgi:PIN domain nuclease of toxin-antitoxin system
VIHLDTHVASWLRAGDRKRLRPVQKLLDAEVLRLSPFVVMELQFLFEIGRLRESGRQISERLANDYDLQVELDQVAEAVDRAHDLGFTRDPFDRLIAGHALAAGVSLLTVDASLHQHVSCARWA